MTTDTKSKSAAPAPAPAPAPPAEKEKARKPAAPPAEKEKDPTKDATDETTKKRPQFYVKERKSITTKVGILSDGDEIKPEHLVGGKARIAELIKTGYIGKG